MKKPAKKKPEKLEKPKNAVTGVKPASQPFNTMSNREFLYGILIIILTVLLMYSFFMGGFNFSKEKTITKPQPTEKPKVEKESTLPTISQDYLGNLPFLGNENAQISLIEFGDYQCNYCKDFYVNTEQKIIKDYIDTGKLKFYYKDFPQLNIHDKAEVSALAARCANEQGKFWEMHDRLYQEQGAWILAQKSGAIERFSEYAESLGLNKEQFSACLKTEKYRDAMNVDYEDGKRLDIRGTPTFLILVPKNKVNLVDLDKVVFKAKGATAERGDNYFVFVEGARDYTIFKEIFDTVK